MSVSASGHGDVECVFDNGEVGGGLTLMDSAIPASISVVTYCESNGEGLVVWQFPTMPLHGKLLQLWIQSQRRQMRYPVGACIKGWKHWGRRAATECETSSSKTDICYDCTFKRAVYERMLSELIASLLIKRCSSEDA